MLEHLSKSTLQDELLAILGNVPILAAKGILIREVLDEIKVRVRSGVPLRGYCDAGRDADPRFE